MGHLKFKLPTKRTRRRRLNSSRTRLKSFDPADGPRQAQAETPRPFAHVSWRLPTFTELLAGIAILSVFAILVATVLWPGQRLSLPKSPFDSPRDVIEASP